MDFFNKKILLDTFGKVRTFLKLRPMLANVLFMFEILSILALKLLSEILTLSSFDEFRSMTKVGTFKLIVNSNSKISIN